jgi:glyoxylase-like metal-dependent hydrolase (beta-lactamase superfamily II)
MIRCIKVYEVIETNCYLYLDDETMHGFIIDPGANGDEICDFVMENGITLEKILLTHGHFDHIGGVNIVKARLGVPIVASQKAREYLLDPMKNLSANHGLNTIIDIDNEDEFLPDGSEIELSSNPDMTLKLIETPGHTEDGCVYYNEHDSVCFCGDTIFRASIGRTDMYGGDTDAIEKSIRERIYALPDETNLLSGHTDPTTVGLEKKYGYFRIY